MKKTRKRFLSLLISLSMIIPFAPATLAAEAEGFTDVNITDWFYDDVSYVAENGYFSGTGISTFSPQAAMTRAMFVAVLARVDGVETDNSASSFTDVPVGEWYTGAVEWAVKNGIVAGMGDGIFAPDQAVTRQQMATFMSRYIEYYVAKNNVTLTAVGSAEAFTDAERIEAYAAEAVKQCRAYGLVSGNTDGSFEPTATSTRAQVAAVIHRLVLLLADDTTETPTVEPDKTTGGASGGSSGGGGGGSSRPSSSDVSADTAGGFETAAEANASVVKAAVTTENYLTVNDDITITNDRASTLTLDLNNASLGKLVVNAGRATTINIQGTAASVSSLVIDAPNASVNNGVEVNGSVDIKSVSMNTFNNTGAISGNIIFSGPGALNDTQKEPVPVIINTGSDEPVAVKGNTGQIKIMSDGASVTLATTNKVAVSSTADSVSVNVDNNTPITLEGTINRVDVSTSTAVLEVNGTVASMNVSQGEIEVSGTGSVSTLTAQNATVEAKAVSIDTVDANGGSVKASGDAVINTVKASGTVRLNANVNTVEASVGTALILSGDTTVNTVEASGQLDVSGGSINSIDVKANVSAEINLSDTDVTQVTTSGDTSKVTVSEPSVQVVTKAAKPQYVSPVAPEKANSRGGIAGVDNTMEYQAVGTDEWTTITGDSVSELASGSYLVRVAATSDSLASDSVTVVIPTAVAVAGVEIQGTAYVGQTLTVIAKANATAPLTYKWTAGEDIIGTGKTLTLTDAHIGKEITVAVTNKYGSDAKRISEVTVDKTALKTLIAKAAEVQTGVAVKPDGTTASDVALNVIFVTETISNSLAAAKTATEQITKVSTSTSMEVTNAEAALRTAIEAYVKAKTAGTKNEVEELRTELGKLVATADGWADENNVKTASDAGNVAPGKSWIGNKTDFNNAITTAKSVSANGTTAEQLSKAIADLNSALNVYLKAIRTGAALDNSALLAAINAAEINAASVVTSADGKNVLPSQIWVSQDVYEAYNKAITTAKRINAAVQNDYIVALNNLNTATDTFNQAKASGTMDIVAPIVSKLEVSLKETTVTVKLTSNEAGKVSYQVGSTNGEWLNGCTLAESGSSYTGTISYGVTAVGKITVYVKVTDTSGNSTVVSGTVGTDPTEEFITVASIGNAKYETLQKAVAAAANGQTVKLEKNVALDAPIDIDKTVTLDLNGNTITPNAALAGDYLLGVKYGGRLTINDSSSDKSGAIDANEDESVYTAVKMTLTGEEYSDKDAELIVNGGLLKGYYYGICGEGGRHHTDITINGGELCGYADGDNLGMYHPQSGDLTINGGTIKGVTGLAMKSGNLTITGGTIIGTGEKADFKHSSGSFNSTGDGLVVEACNYPGGVPQVVEISGGTFISAKNQAIAYYQQSDEYKIANTKFITGGTFSDLSCVNYLYKTAEVNIELNGNKTLTDHVRVTDGNVINLDLNEHTVSYDFAPFIVYGGELNVTGKGTIAEAKENQYAAIMVFGSDDVMKKNYSVVTVGKDVTLSGWAPVFVNRTNEDDNKWDVPNTKDCACGVNISIAGKLISPGIGEAAGYGIYVNGSIKETKNYPLITIEKTANISATYEAIYAAGYAEWEILGGKLIGGESGVEIRAGILNMSGGSITGNGGSTSVDPNGSGATAVGVGLAVVQHTTKLPIEVTISGGEITGCHAFYESNPQNNSEEDIGKVKISITGGNFVTNNGGDNAIYSENKKGFITGGTFSTDPSIYLAEGYTAAQNVTVYEVEAPIIENSISLTSLFEESEEEQPASDALINEKKDEEKTSDEDETPSTKPEEEDADKNKASVEAIIKKEGPAEDEGNPDGSDPEKSEDGAQTE